MTHSNAQPSDSNSFETSSNHLDALFYPFVQDLTHPDLRQGGAGKFPANMSSSGISQSTPTPATVVNLHNEEFIAEAQATHRILKWDELNSLEELEIAISKGLQVEGLNTPTRSTETSSECVLIDPATEGVDALGRMASKTIPQNSPVIPPAVDDRVNELIVLADQEYREFILTQKPETLDQACEHYHEALAQNPTSALAYVGMAKTLWEKGDIDLALAKRYCELAFSLDGVNAEAALYCGYFSRQLDQREDAQNYFRLAIDLNPRQSVKARMALGSLLVNAAHQAKGISVWSRLHLASNGVGQVMTAMALLPLDATSTQPLVQALLRDVQEGAMVSMSQLLYKLSYKQQAIELMESASRQGLLSPSLYSQLGKWHLESGTPTQAVEALESALKLYQKESHPPLTFDTVVDTVDMPKDGVSIVSYARNHQELLTLHQDLANAHSQAQNPAAAIEHYEASIALGGKTFEAVYDLAQLHLDQQRYFHALYYFKESLSLNPTHAYSFSNMAYALFKLEDYDGAIYSYQQALKFGQEPLWLATVAQTLGTLFYKVKQDPGSAMQLFQMAVKLDPENLQAQTTLVDLYTDLGDIPAAVDIYEKIVDKNPHNGDCHTYLGYLLWQMDRNDEAVASYRKALKWDPFNAIAMNNLGVIYLDELGDLDNALEMFQQALDVKQNYTMACFNVARVYEKQGHAPEAATYFARAKALNEKSPELVNEDIDERIERLFDL